MEPAKKNKPGPLVVVAFSIIILLVIFYFILTMFFPDLFDSLNVGAAKPVDN